LGKIPSRTQSSIALSSGFGKWFLVNASPDLPQQIQATPQLQPCSDTPRNTPIAGVLLTNADLDHVLGLFSLREGDPVNIYATSAVQQTLKSCLGLNTILETFCGVSWNELPKNDFVPFETYEKKPALLFRAIEIAGKPPPYSKQILNGRGQSVAFQFADPQTGKKLLVAPDVSAMNDELQEALTTSEAILFDGTFWSADELSAIKPTAPRAGEMGHLTIKDCSLELLRNTRARHKVYIHINNTNPILSPASPERAEVEAAGILVGVDGFEFEL
jgi:pyrroloquinoline quinone biosynthesis protein B